MQQEIYIIDDDDSSILVFKELFKNDVEYKFINVKSEEIDFALKNIPSLIIINEDAVDRDVVQLCKQIRSDEDNTITPVIVVSSNGEKNHRINILEESIEYYIKKPVDEEYLYYTIKNLERLLSINRRISPLTGLPGNVQIHAELKKRLLNRETFTVLYFDLDNFKAYNDVYGFAAGDEIIKYTSKLIMQSVHALEDNDSFNGHIGGDDFVSIISPADYDELCKNVIAHFDNEIEHFYNEEDVRRGYIEVANRRGIIEQFPLVSISIAVVEVDLVTLKSALEIGEIAAQVKHRAKEVMGSSYIINRRRN
jgi:diguanylate cyclase (GGDEF)-like protein